MFCVLEPSPTLRVDRHSAEHFGWQNDASADELAFRYRCTRQRGDYTGDSERFFFKLEAGSSEQTPATSAAAAKLQDLTQWDLTAGAALGSFSVQKPSRGWNIQPKSFLLRAIRGANTADRPLAAFPRRDNKLMSCQGQKWEQIVSRGNKLTG